ncbi:MAG: tetratricopeptide repeat protein [Thermonemataceae bacterium]|nr:tetratricopeptide repeat protein [Thermonemataceae bacterium]
MRFWEQKVLFYRNLGFLEQYADYSFEELCVFVKIQSENSYWGDIDENTEDTDKIILSLDKQKVWFIEDYTRFGGDFQDRARMYEKCIEHLSLISDYYFSPENLSVKQKGFCSGRSERWEICFTYKNQLKTLLFCGDSDVLSLHWLSELNNFLEGSDKNFIHTSLSEDSFILVFFLSKTQIEQLTDFIDFEKIEENIYVSDIADFYFEQELYEEAITHYEKVIRKKNDYWFAYSQLATCYTYLQKYEKVKKTYQEAIEMLSLHPNSRNEIESWYLNFFENQIKNINI